MSKLFELKEWLTLEGATDYQPLARQANNQVFLPPKGLPAGPYHLEYGRDQEKF
jgi:hypothetical protein